MILRFWLVFGIGKIKLLFIKMEKIVRGISLRGDCFTYVNLRYLLVI